MKRFVLRLFTCATLLVLTMPAISLAAATGPGNGSADSIGGAGRVYLPLIGKNTTFLPLIIPETTNVLDATTGQHLVAVSADGATYRFDQNTAALQRLAPGESMVSAPANLAPDGFLRRVTAINTGGGQVVVQTQAATLEDAIQQGEVYVSQQLSPTNTQALEITPGAILMPAAVAAPIPAFS